MSAHVCTLEDCWGWRCKRIERAPKEWKCPGCGAKDKYVMVRPDDLKICPDCAKQRHLEEV